MYAHWVHNVNKSKILDLLPRFHTNHTRAKQREGERHFPTFLFSLEVVKFSFLDVKNVKRFCDSRNYFSFSTNESLSLIIDGGESVRSDGDNFSLFWAEDFLI